MDPSPALNDPIMLRDRTDREYRSRVEGVGEGVLTVARPLDLPADHELGPGAEVLVTWNSARGIAVLPTRLIGSYTERNLPLWSMAVIGAGWVEQRRRFVRVPASGPLTLRLLDGSRTGEEEQESVIDASLVDLSEGALRCTLDVLAADGLAADTEVTASFRFGDRDFTLPARIAFRRPSARPAELAELVVLFQEPVNEADALRKLIFAQQLRTSRAHARGR